MKKMFVVFSMLFWLVFTTVANATPVTIGQSIRFTDGIGTTNGGPFHVYDWNTNEFLYDSFCLETNEYLNFGGQFIVGDISTEARSGGTGGGSPDPIDERTAYLFHSFYWVELPGYSATNENADALQRAIWYFEGETGGQQNAYTILAQQMVDSGLWSGLGDVRVANLFYANGTRAQDQLTVAPVPEPATMLLLGTGMICLAGFGRKKLFKR